MIVLSLMLMSGNKVESLQRFKCYLRAGFQCVQHLFHIYSGVGKFIKLGKGWTKYLFSNRTNERRFQENEAHYTSNSNEFFIRLV